VYNAPEDHCHRPEEDIANDQLMLFENIDPFTGEKYKKK